MRHQCATRHAKPALSEGGTKAARTPVRDGLTPVVPSELDRLPSVSPPCPLPLPQLILRWSWHDPSLCGGLLFRVCPRTNELLHHAQVIIIRRKLQWSDSVHIGIIYARGCADELLHDGEVAVEACVVQRCSAVYVGRVDGGAGPDQLAHRCGGVNVAASTNEFPYSLIVAVFR